MEKSFWITTNFSSVKYDICTQKKKIITEIGMERHCSRFALEEASCDSKLISVLHPRDDTLGAREKRE